MGRMKNEFVRVIRVIRGCFSSHGPPRFRTPELMPQLIQLSPVRTHSSRFACNSAAAGAVGEIDGGEMAESCGEGLGGGVLSIGLGMKYYLVLENGERI